MTVDPPFVTRARGWTWPGVVAATLVAAVGDAAFAFIAYVLIARRFNFETLLQYIASGLLGESAFTTGRAGIGVAALGFAIHLALAAVFTFFYALVIAPRVHTLPIATAIGAAYGAAIWVFMNTVVLPLGHAAGETFLSGYYLAFLVDHALLVGLPIAVILFVFVRRRAADLAQFPSTRNHR
ncbi:MULTISPECIES: hypothetical protein [Mycobacteriaceae]|uniref:DUF1440 domain-containing protein n=3 Tax=Mycobacteriaceae TaxID=1762 RepID=A0A9P3UT89_9MYCO|nr:MULTISPECIES: hypothetical protein [Mycobacteriaceae]ATO71637.2 hypothetical protein BJP74_09450 [Mycobacterium avium subsp. hominissuis]TDH25868.1 hypothetical protein EJ571_00755 [Mycobacteroides franklinii]GLB86159.1 hypothetical protein SRL2020028_54150 [Mycobacterium kiyosense]GLB97819.1 hypothetical protein SRL2020226_45950 [Mycobacterium kiyosense]GLC18711.1 hypothetical protein SRL2020472_12820 [Mycobacterium kiyosense]